VEQAIREFLTIDYSHSSVGKNGDVLIVFFKSGKYWICDKEYGVQQSDNPLYLRVLRIFGAGRTNI
jgi:hypothetical protein